MPPFYKRYVIWIVRKPYVPGFIIVYPLIEIGLLLKILYFYIQISRNNFSVGCRYRFMMAWVIGMFIFFTIQR